VIGGLVSIVRMSGIGAKATPSIERYWTAAQLSLACVQTEATLGALVGSARRHRNTAAIRSSAYTFSALAGYRITEWVRTKPPAYRVCAT
jgi:hypothetical protein